MPFQITRRCDNHEADSAELAHDKAEIPRPSDPDRHVKAFIHHMRNPVGEAHIKFDIRINECQRDQMCTTAIRPAYCARRRFQVAHAVQIMALNLLF